jgi:ABC-type transporter MlaC component
MFYTHSIRHESREANGVQLQEPSTYWKKMRLRQIVRGTLLGLTVTTFAFAAQGDTAGAQQFIEGKQTQIRTLVTANAPKADVTKVIDSMIDYKAITQRALGNPCPSSIPSCTNHWAAMSPDQQAEMLNLYTQLIAKKINDNAQKTKDYDVTYKNTKDLGNDLNKVRTEAQDRTKPRDPPTQIDYVVHQDTNASPVAYKTWDIVNEGSWLTKNYYDQSHKMLITDGQGYNYLVQKLKDRIAGKTKEKMNGQEEK